MYGSKDLVLSFLGADIPGITEDIIHTAFQILHNKETDMVLGKAEDGGYYLIGLHKSAKKYLGTVNGPGCTVKPVYKGHSKIDKTKILMTKSTLMKVKSIAECSHWSIWQYF